MITIGIDPGTATTGFSILEKDRKGKIKLLDYGCIKTASNLKANIRLNQIATDLRTLIKKWKPDFASIEKLFFNKNVKTAIAVSQARGVIIQILTELGIEQAEYTPLEVKSAVCGYGRADKKMVQDMVKILLGLSKVPKPDDAADAIAIALCSINSLKIK
ncbi:MAG: crossover junction endodeoxyribonuclease RuvC [Candidatus Gracilibacteria bacterium]|jgi:crossover junction endodeoxyribonuclease RuvC